MKREEEDYGEKGGQGHRKKDTSEEVNRKKR